MGFNEGAQFFNRGRSGHPVRQESDGALQGLVHLLAGGQSDEELKRLKWLACGTLVAESNILEIKRSHASSNMTRVETSLCSEVLHHLCAHAISS